jgi:hypothetical protein
MMHYSALSKELFAILLITSCSSGQLVHQLPSTDPRIEQAPMTAETKSVARDYFDSKPSPKAFAFSPEKGTNWAAWGSSSVEAAKELAMQQCEERTRTRCVLFAINDQIVWQPGGVPQVAEPEMSSPRFAIQVAAVRDAAKVPGEWQRLAKRYQTLAGLKPQAPTMVDVPGKGTFYRVIGGAFATKTEAQAVCEKLRSAGGYCTIAEL